MTSQRYGSEISIKMYMLKNMIKHEDREIEFENMQYHKTTVLLIIIVVLGTIENEETRTLTFLVSLCLQEIKKARSGTIFFYLAEYYKQRI